MNAQGGDERVGGGSSSNNNNGDAVADSGGGGGGGDTLGATTNTNGTSSHNGNHQHLPKDTPLSQRFDVVVWQGDFNYRIDGACMPACVRSCVRVCVCAGARACGVCRRAVPIGEC